MLKLNNKIWIQTSNYNYKQNQKFCNHSINQIKNSVNNIKNNWKIKCNNFTKRNKVRVIIIRNRNYFKIWAGMKIYLKVLQNCMKIIIKYAIKLIKK